MAGGLGGAGPGEGDAVSSQPSDAVATASGSGAPDAVGTGLRSATGTVEVVVRFEGDAEFGPRAASNGEGMSTADLKSSAESAQGDFERFAERKPGVTVERSFWLANAMLVTVDTESVAVERLLDVRGVERVHENFRVELDSAAGAGGGGGDSETAVGAPSPVAGPTAGAVSASSTSANATYGVEMVRAPEVWEEFDTRGAGATVAVLDTGIDPNHPDLTVSGWAEYDAEGNLVSDDVSDASDVNGHGTHVAGTVAGGNASGTAIGVAPEADLYGVKVLGDDGTGSFAQVVAGMEYATDNTSADVLQMSLGAQGYESGFIEPVQNARSTGKVVVASAGNSGSGASSSPGNVYDSFAVGAVDANRDVASFSGGETLNTSADWNDTNGTAEWPAEYVVPDASAPGVDVNSSLSGGGYGLKDGTSMAAPHVSGVAALVLSSTSRNVSDDELYDAIRSTANHPKNNSTADTRYGTGIVDAYAAVSSTEPSYDVSDLGSPPIVERNGTIDATATVTNAGRIPGENRTVELRLTDPANESDVRELAATNVSLGVDNATTVALDGTVPSDFGTGETAVALATPEGTVNATARVADAVGTVNGTVTDAETNATLSAVDVVVRNGTETVAETTTGESGSYDVDVPATSLTATASNATYAPANETVDLNGSGDAATANFSLTLRNGTLAGFVNASDDLGRPSNATVTVTNETNATVAAVDAADDGSYAIDLRPGSYDVTAEAPDFLPDARAGLTVDPNATTDPELVLDPKAATLSGTVTNESSGDPVAGATVTAGSASTDTGTDGNYSVTVDRGDRTLAVSAAGYNESSRTLDLAANESREADVPLTPTAVFAVASISGPNEIEQGSSGEFTIEVRNDGRAAGTVTAIAAVSPSGTVDPASQSFSGVAVGATRSATVMVSLGDGASTEKHEFTASIESGDDAQTRSFDAVSGGDNDDENTDDGGSGGGGGAGGGGGTGGGGSTVSDGEAETTEPTNETDDPTNETTEPTNETTEPTNETDDIANGTAEPTDEGEPVDDEPTADDADGSDESDGVSGSDGVEADENGDTAAPDDDTSDDEAPGFGVIAGVAALLSAALVARLRGGTG